MDYVCDAPNDETWFRLTTEAEAMTESEQMGHAVEKHFHRERERALDSFQPIGSVYIEQEIGKEDHVKRSMPLFLTLRNQDGAALVTAMLPPRAKGGGACIVVGRNNTDPYPDYADAIHALGAHFGMALDRAQCFPYRR